MFFGCWRGGLREIGAGGFNEARASRAFLYVCNCVWCARIRSVVIVVRHCGGALDDVDGKLLL